MLSAREHFPILQPDANGKHWIYLDSGATAQKPRCVLQAMDAFYQTDNANVHRGVYQLSQRATQQFEQTRDKVQRFINAPSREQIIFTSGATAALNLVAQSFGRTFLQAGDEILLSEMEHHANIVPWQMLCQQIGAKLRIIPILANGQLDMAAYRAALNERVKIVAVTHVSNVLGTINPIQEITKLAHAHQAIVVVDGAQAVPHVCVDVQQLDCDFYVFSAHKMYGPTGIGILYGNKTLLESMPPYQGGGDMIRAVTFQHTEYNDLPYKFEAGTPNIAAVIGLGAAVDFLQQFTFEQIEAHEQQLLSYATERLQQLPGLQLFGLAQPKIGVLSFVMPDVHAHDVGTIVDQARVAIRVGHHCAMPLMERLGVAATTRVSLGIYNEQQDIDVLLQALQQAQALFCVA